MSKYRKLVVAVAGLLVVLGVDNELVDALVAVATSVLVYALPNES